MTNFELFNEHLFSDVYFRVKHCRQRYAVVYGSSNSSKSYSVHQNELINIMYPGKGDTLILRKYGVDIRESSYKLLIELMHEFGVANQFKTTYSTESRKITCLTTGRTILFKGLDDSERIKSIVGVRRVVMEEASEFTLEEFMELTRRARGFEDIQFTLILNPVSEKHWIKQHLCEPDGGYFPKTEVFKFTFKDNRFAREEDIENLEMLKRVSENQYRIYALGEWGIEDKQYKFAYAFDESKHVGKVEHNPREVTWLTFDFNVNPMTCTVIQHYDEMVKVIRCIRLENSNTWEMCERIKALYPGCFFKVTGDATGANRNAAIADNMDNYSVIIQQLGLSRNQVTLPNKNPSVEDNQTRVNALFNNYPIQIDPDNCAPLIYDLNYVEMNPKKEIVKDRTSAKKYSDFLDNFRYWVNMQFNDIGMLVKR